MLKLGIVLIMCASGARGIAGENPDYSIGLYQAGKPAEAVYRALDVPEVIETGGARSYKIGKNIVCVRSVQVVSRKETMTYFCSSGLNHKGESESISE